VTGGEQELTEYAAVLADGIDEALPRWVARSVERVVTAWAGSVPDEIWMAAAEAGERARLEVGPAVRALLGSDVDQQATTPLALIRTAVAYPTAVLRAAGVPAARRDGFAERAFPEDVYDLSPASLSDVDPGLAEAGLAWGAAKAFVHRRRHTTGHGPPGQTG
jgi:hypothetical protein